MTPYSILGVAPGVSAADIQAAYRQRAQRAHPDRVGGSAEVMSALNDAYRILRDPKLRKQLDEGLRKTSRAPGAAADVGTRAASLGDRDRYAHLRAAEIDARRIERPVLSRDGWVMPDPTPAFDDWTPPVAAKPEN